MPAVTDRNFFKRPFRNLRQKCSHALRQHDVGLHDRIFFRRDRWHVHRILNHSVLQILLHLLRDLHAHGLLRLERRSADMRREHDVFQRQQRRVLRRLFRKNIERRRRHLLLLERLRQIRLIHQFAASAIHQPHALLHLRDGCLIDHARSLRRQPHVQRDVVRRSIHFVQPRQPDPLLLRHRHRHKRIVRHQLHAKGPRPPRHFHADPVPAR